MAGTSWRKSAASGDFCPIRPSRRQVQDGGPARREGTAMRILRPTLLALATCAMCACSPSPTETETTASAAPPPMEAPAKPVIGIDIAGMDTSVQPGDDFEAYANGGWRETAEIPADRASPGRSPQALH